MILKNQQVDSQCRTYKAENGYTNVTICNCKYPKR